MADTSRANLLRDYLGFGTGFALGALVFFFAALAFCFCAACLCVAFGDLSPIERRVRFLTIGVNTDRHRSNEISLRFGHLLKVTAGNFAPKAEGAGRVRLRPNRGFPHRPRPEASPRRSVVRLEDDIHRPLASGGMSQSEREFAGITCQARPRGKPRFGLPLFKSHWQLAQSWTIDGYGTRIHYGFFRWTRPHGGPAACRTRA